SGISLPSPDLCNSALNSAVEAVVDRIGGEIYPLAGRAKDMGSAAVLLTILLAVFVWIILLVPHLR
ncbi:diacylglycerol kinase, partial [Candidatus Erwinia dacicola]